MTAPKHLMEKIVILLLVFMVVLLLAAILLLLPGQVQAQERTDAGQPIQATPYTFTRAGEVDTSVDALIDRRSLQPIRASREWRYPAGSPAAVHDHSRVSDLPGNVFESDYPNYPEYPDYPSFDD